MKRCFAESIEIGRTGERAVARRLERSGWYVIPSYDYTGSDGNKAPKMRRGGDALVIPDLDGCRDGERAWFEVKTKSEPSLHRATNTIVHGIDRRHWESYLRVQEQSGCRVYLVILELSSGDTLVAPIDRLKLFVRYGVGGGSSMVYWPRTSFNVAKALPP